MPKSKGGNDKHGSAKPTMMYPCPFCGKDEEGTPKSLFTSEDDLGNHIKEKHSDRMTQGPGKLPDQLREDLNKLLQPVEKGGLGCTSWTLVTLDTRSGLRLTSSIIPVEGRQSIEQMMAIEGLLMLLAENRQSLSGRAVSR